jgi:hypothetical protein
MEAYAIICFVYVPPITPESRNSGTTRDATMEYLLDAFRVMSNAKYLVKGQ